MLLVQKGVCLFLAQPVMAPLTGAPARVMADRARDNGRDVLHAGRDGVVLLPRP
ncbi:hypothetical protein RM704_09470 [Streptomyces sp. DSM 3412]|uniref:Uncharacterized protein n=1 Tax=Streptomyces gottesmaniae TaxID=3075518 RepID=A0ABU2YUN3_9ACTN|nr:hypothetical protein [Streptomyces sp. DSM 3412]MDT0567696.1 hypothetical protein [Streptomyces sp. DSM 3412]